MADYWNDIYVGFNYQTIVHVDFRRVDYNVLASTAVSRALKLIYINQNCFELVHISNILESVKGAYR